MKFYLPDSQDLVDPSFDFESETRNVSRTRQRDDEYTHEIFAGRAFDGILVSKGIVDGFGENGGRYTLAQRQRLLRAGAKEFFRIAQCSWPGAIPIMGDCGAFTYVNEESPPYSVDEVIDFYLHCGFDQGISVDHVILANNSEWDNSGDEIARKMAHRQTVTLELAQQFIKRQKQESLPFEPLGVAQGWSPRSYAHSVSELQKMGYNYIAVGGTVPLKTNEILQCLQRINEIRNPSTRLHLLGVMRIDHLASFAQYGVASFDNTSPLRQAFKDDKDNYYTPTRTYPAIRIPQVEGNAKLARHIQAGRISQEKARKLERNCLSIIKRFDINEATTKDVIDQLQQYEDLCDTDKESRKKPKKSRVEEYKEVLEDRPWKNCPCEVCTRLGYHVILFRGAERNRRRGLHNVWVYYRRLQRELAAAPALSRPSISEAQGEAS